MFFLEFGHAGLTFPYKTIEVECKGQGHRIVLKWDFSKSPFVTNVVVNGVESRNGMRAIFSNDTETYMKEGEFSISLPGHAGKNFATQAEIKGQEIEMLCQTSTSWHIVN